MLLTLLLSCGSPGDPKVDVAADTRSVDPAAEFQVQYISPDGRVTMTGRLLRGAPVGYWAVRIDGRESIFGATGWEWQPPTALTDSGEFLVDFVSKDGRVEMTGRLVHGEPDGGWTVRIDEDTRYFSASGIPGWQESVP